MIPRYSRPEMAAIWSPETRFRIWFEIEAHAAEAMAELGIDPGRSGDSDLREGRQGRSSTSPASTRSSATTKHDVIAFLTHVAEMSGRRRASCIRA